MKKIILSILFLFFYSALIADSDDDELFDYTVKSGDTLAKISSEFLNNPGNYPELLKYNKLDSPDRIVPGLILKIPAHLAKVNLELDKIAILDFKTGTVVMKRDKNGKDVPVKKNDRFQSGDIIITSAKSSASIYFPRQPEARISLMENTIVKISEESNVKVLTMKNGDLQVSVYNQDKNKKEEKLKISTLTSSAAVRGTQFSIAIDESGNDRYSCYEGLMQVSAGGVDIELPGGFGSEVAKGAAPAKPIKLLDKVQILPPEVNK